MSGIFGVIAPERRDEIGPIMESMVRAMSHRPWYVADRYIDLERGLGLGRIGIGVFNREKQPVRSEDGSLMVWLSGELYQTAELRRGVMARGCLLRDDSDLELILRLYEEKGKQFIGDLRGVFVLMIWDHARQELLIANDRFGLYPLFYAHHGSGLLFAPEMKGILCDDSFPRQLDLTALAQYMRSQQVLGERTFFEGINLLPAGSILLYKPEEDECQVRSYWTFDRIPYRPQVSFAEAAEEAGGLLRRAVQRLSADAYRAGVYLSGGLDSRTILGMVARRPVVSLTYGVAGCRDVFYARRVAEATGSDHHWFDMPNAEWLKQNLSSHLELTEGYHSWIHAHGIHTLPRARELVDVNLTGWDGGTVMGHEASIEPLQTDAVDDAALITRAFHLLNQEWTWPGITEAEEQQLYTHSLLKEIRGRAFESFHTEFARFLGYRPDVRGEYFYISNHCRRFSFNMVTFLRSHIEARFPFFDYDLFDFLYSLPARLRGRRVLYRAVIQRETPRLARIPYAYDEFLPTDRSLLRSLHGFGVRLKRRINRHVAPVFPELLTLYADYENYLRTDLREWAESILFDKRTLERGIFDPAFLRSIWARHQSGREMHTIGKIAPIMTYEMMLRRLYD